MSSAFELIRARSSSSTVQVQYNRAGRQRRARRPEEHPDLHGDDAARRSHHPGGADLPGQRLRRLLLPPRLQIRGEVQPRLHRRRGQGPHRDGDRVRKGGRHDAARAATDHRMAREGAPALRRRPPRLRRRRARVGLPSPGACRSGEARSEEGTARRHADAWSWPGLAQERWRRPERRDPTPRGRLRRRRTSRRSARDSTARVRASKPCSRRRRRERLHRRAAAVERRAALPDEGLQPGVGRSQRDHRRVPEHDQLSGRAVAARGDVLRAEGLPGRAPRLSRDRRSRRRAPLRDLLRQGARAARRRLPAAQRSARDPRAHLPEDQPGAPGAGRRGAALREGQGLLPPGVVERRDGLVRAGRQHDRLRAPGALLPGPRRHEGGAGGRRRDVQDARPSPT